MHSVFCIKTVEFKASYRHASSRFAYSLLLASTAVFGLASSAYSFTLTDDPSVSAANTIYYGAENTYTHQDVIGTSTFNILDAVITRTGVNNNTLNIKIYTNFVGAPSYGGSGWNELWFVVPEPPLFGQLIRQQLQPITQGIVS